MAFRMTRIGLLSVMLGIPVGIAGAETGAAGSGQAVGTDAATVVRQLGNVSASGVPDEDDRLGELARAGMAASPDDPMWRVGWVLAEAYSGRSKDVLEEAESLVVLLPQEAGAQYALGLCLISTIDDVALWNKGARAGRARELWQGALALDPSHVGARQALIEYYRHAPGIAGGSKEKARELAEAGLAHPEGSHLWRMTLGQLAADEGDWVRFGSEFDEAVASAPEGALPRIATVRARTLLMTKEDAAAALASVQPVADASGDTQACYVCGRALRELGRCEEAVAYYSRALDQTPSAQHSRIELGLCLAEMGRKAEARDHLERFVRDHPKSDRVKEAKRALKELR